MGGFNLCVLEGLLNGFISKRSRPAAGRRPKVLHVFVPSKLALLHSDWAAESILVFFAGPSVSTWSFLDEIAGGSRA